MFVDSTLDYLSYINCIYATKLLKLVVEQNQVIIFLLLVL